MNAFVLPLWAEIAVAALVVLGSLIAFLGSFSLMRLKSYFERVHAPSIIATLGCWCIMHATIIFFSASGQGLSLHAILIAIFLAVTVPITAIFLMRAALFRARRAGREDVPPSVSRIVRNAPAAPDEAQAQDAAPGTAPSAATDASQKP